MGLSLPWSILAAFGIYALVAKLERSTQRLVVALSVIILGATSVRWMFREIGFVQNNVANTGRHPVFLGSDVSQIVNYLNGVSGRKIVLALPGAASPAVDSTTNQPIPDEKPSPALPDLAPFASGFTGAYAYAGHWSETPQYERRCGDMYAFFFREPVGSVHRVMSPEERKTFARSIGANFAILPSADFYKSLPLVSAADLGDIVVSGKQFSLVKLRR